MTIRELLLPEFDLEMQYTRRHLERVPEGRFDWKPNERSMPLGRLAGFLAVIPSWSNDVLQKDSFDVAPATPTPRGNPPTSRAQLLELFDKNVAAGRKAIEETSDEQMQKPWSLMAGGKLLFSQPRYQVLRMFFLNHTVHHRAQLGVYLRMNGVPVPAVYNDSADEKGGIFMEPATTRH